MILYSLSSCRDEGRRQQMMQDMNEPMNEVAVAATANQNVRPTRSTDSSSMLSRLISLLMGN